MLKRDIADRYYSMAIKRIRKEKPNAILTNNDFDCIWLTLYGMVKRNILEESILEYINNAPIVDSIKEG